MAGEGSAQVRYRRPARLSGSWVKPRVEQGEPPTTCMASSWNQCLTTTGHHASVLWLVTEECGSIATGPTLRRSRPRDRARDVDGRHSSGSPTLELEALWAQKVAARGSQSQRSRSALRNAERLLDAVRAARQEDGGTHAREASCRVRDALPRRLAPDDGSTTGRSRGARSWRRLKPCNRRFRPAVACRVACRAHLANASH